MFEDDNSACTGLKKKRYIIFLEETLHLKDVAQGPVSLIHDLLQVLFAPGAVKKAISTREAWD